jgi:CDP-diacylglycerol--glycerol-3-phosphate 3-phosphatidyltransferase
MKHKKAFMLVNLITFYRLTAALLLLILLARQEFGPFRCLLILSFLTDAVDGYLARRFNVLSVFGARVDSVADDLTVLVAILGIVVYRPDFLRSEWLLAAAMVLLYLAQNTAALIRYRKLTSFHTVAAKIAALLQGAFLILVFFLPEPLRWFFYLTAAATLMDLTEEILLVFLLPQWQANVKGVYWVLKNRGLPYGGHFKG